MANVKRLTERSKSRRKTASEELEVKDETDGNGNEEGRGEQAQEQRKQDDPSSQRQRRSLYNQFISTVTRPFSSLGLSRQATGHRSDNIERSTRETAYDIPRQVYRRVRIMADRDVHQYPVFTKSIQYDKVQSRTQSNPWRKHGVVSKLSEIGGTFVPRSTDKNRNKSNVEIAKGSAPPADPRCPAILLNYDPIMRIKIPASPLGMTAQEAAHLVGNQIHQLVVSRGYNLNKTHNGQSASRRTTTVSLPQGGLDRVDRGERPGQSNQLSGSNEAPRLTSHSQTHREPNESAGPTPFCPPSQPSLNPHGSSNESDGSEELSDGSEEAKDSPREVTPSKRRSKRRHRLG
ncbi:hypothetical protein WR25_24586 [Diploscapter pachys]|uniref:Uncharacterized protein n=1 Tax=Diploscapter pachys TaxID=2018661 RepID=A0A2A2JBZ8_9BILA|nr:hypothetical protein WR25_24586 [Diploscapter pachys]